MIEISRETYLELVASGTVIEQDLHGIKVLALADGNIAKFFRLKSVFSSALLKPYALRFVRNAAVLARLGVPTVDVVDVCRCRPCQRHIVIYKPLPGNTLRSLLAENVEGDAGLLEQLASFLAELHCKGILFRSIHFGNIVIGERGIGLIDVADMTFRKGALSLAARLRNFLHMTRYAEDRDHLQSFGFNRFLDVYWRQASLPIQEKQDFGAKIDAKLAERKHLN